MLLWRYVQTDSHINIHIYRETNNIRIKFCNGNSVSALKLMQHQLSSRTMNPLSVLSSSLSSEWNTPKSIIGTVNHHNFTIMHILLHRFRIVSIPFLFRMHYKYLTKEQSPNMCACCMKWIKKNWTIERYESEYGGQTKRMPSDRMKVREKAWMRQK